MSYTRILCPIDLSSQSTLLVRHAMDLAEGVPANVHVLHAVEPFLLQAATSTGTERILRAELARRLDDIVAAAVDDGDALPTVGTSLTDGPPHAAILDASTRCPCDLIVMGTHGTATPEHAGFGSTLERVLRSTTVPVVAIPPRSPGIVGDNGRLALRNLVAAIDFDQPSMASACAAASYARRLGATLTLLHVMAAAPSWTGRQEAVARQHALRRKRAEHELGLLARELGDGGPPVRIVVLDGSPWERIAGFANERTDTLVVLGLRGPAGRSVARPGPVANRVLSADTHPILLIPSDVCVRAAA